MDDVAGFDGADLAGAALAGQEAEEAAASAEIQHHVARLDDSADGLLESLAVSIIGNDLAVAPEGISMHQGNSLDFSRGYSPL